MKASVEGNAGAAIQEIEVHDGIAVEAERLSGAGDKADVADKILHRILDRVARDGRGAELGLDEGRVQRHGRAAARSRALDVDGRRDVVRRGEVRVEHKGERRVGAVHGDGDGGEVVDEDGLARVSLGGDTHTKRHLDLLDRKLGYIHLTLSCEEKPAQRYSLSQYKWRVVRPNPASTSS